MQCRIATFLFPVLLVCLTPAVGYGQAPKFSFNHLGYEQGLSNTFIESIVQDHQGYMWFGTRDGLDRYDGHEMRIYRHDDHDSGSISDNYINFLYEDHTHILWVGTSDGLNSFDPATDRFTHYLHADRDVNSLAGNMISAICEDRQNHLWISTNEGLSSFDPANHRFVSYRLSTTFPEYSGKGNINDLCCDSEGRLWAATNAGLFYFDSTDHSFKRPSFPNLPANLLLKFVKADQGKLWLGTQSSGLYQLDPATGAVTAFRHDERNDSSISSNMIESLLLDRAGRLWIGTINGGLNLLNRTTGSFHHYQEQRELEQGLSKRTASALFEDRDGNFWVGTHHGGVNISSPYGNKFTVYRKGSPGKGLNYDDVNAIFEDPDSNLWLGTDGGGLNYFNRHNNTYSYYRYDPNDPHSLGANEVLHIFRDRQGDLWVTTWGGGLNRLNRSGKSFIRYKNDPADSTTISSNYVQSTLEDSRGQLWVATYYGGLNRFDKTTGKFHRMTTDPSGQTQLYGNNIVSMAEDHSGKLWFGTDDGGLNCYDPIQKHFRHYFNESSKKNDLRVIFIDRDHHIWVGQEGLFLYDPAHDRFNPYPEQSALATEFIKGITQDDHHHLWISTSRGLIQFDPQDSSIRKYNTSDGLQGLEFENNSCLQSRDGEMFFGGLNGFNSFYPDNIRINRHVPPVYITGLQIFNQKIRVTDALVLSHNQSSIAFTFAVLNYTNPEKNQYAYTLEGFEKEWHYTNNDNRANYTNLDPGEYTFRVKASNNDGVWNETGSSIHFFINPPFWKTNWFLFLLSLVMVCSVYAVYLQKRKTQVKKMEEKKREELVQLQLQFFTNISHELRTPLMLILGPAERLLKEDATPAIRNYHQSIYRNASRLLNLINELMDYRKLQGGALKLQVVPGNLNSFLSEISEEFNDWARVKSIRFNLKLDNQLPDTWYDRQVLEKIVLNLLSNAFKYTTTGGTVEMDVLPSLESFRPAFTNEIILLNEHRADNYIYVRIRDNGIGISADSIRHIFERYYRVSEYHLGSGIGLAFVKSLTLLHKGDIYVYSERHRGTEIIIGIPSGEDNYLPEEKWTKQEAETRTKLESLQSRYDEDYPVAATALGPVPEKGTHARHILITEDNEELRSFLRDCLQPFYDVSEATDGASGLRKTKEGSPDLIISDVMMPVMNGIEFCKRVKGDIETSHIPFLMLTAKDANPDKVEGAEAGADIYLPKPVNVQFLLLTLRNIFDQREKLREHYIKGYQVDTRELLHSTKDKDFMDRLLGIIDAELMNPDLDIEFLCRKVNMSRSKLYEKIKALTGQATGDFIRTLRLKKAVDIMLHEDVSLMEIAIRVGIQTQSYFTKAFKKQYGKTPMQFMQDLVKK